MDAEEIKKLALQRHQELKGKLTVKAKAPLDRPEALHTFYTPGVAAVSRQIAEHPEQARRYTIKANTVAVVSDGSAVLGLGNIGPLGALPVMEGKAMIFKEFADIDAFPIVLDTQDTDEIVTTIKNIAPAFGGINLEDFAAPKCFEIEHRLKAELDIPVMHDDQHGTAIVVLAGLINALKVVGKTEKGIKVTMIGAGAAGTAIAKLLIYYTGNAIDIKVVDSKGILVPGRDFLNNEKVELADITNPTKQSGSLQDALTGSDVLIGVSGPNIISKDDVQLMAKRPVIFAMANPDPEIIPDDAHSAGAAVIATGRSDFPNQLNNALVFPGFFRGALDNGVRNITDEHKVAAAKALARLVSSPTPRGIIPSPLDSRVVPTVADAIR